MSSDQDKILYFKVPKDIFELPFFDHDKAWTKGEAMFFLYWATQWGEGEIEVRGNYILVHEGQVGWSIKSLARKWRWSTSKVSLFLLKLEKESQIKTQKNNITSIITMKKYFKMKHNVTQNEPEKSHRSNTEVTQTSPINKNKEELKELKEELPPELKALSEIPGYRFDVMSDGKYLLSLIYEFNTIDPLSLLKGWSKYLKGNPLNPIGDHQVSLRNQFVAAKTHGFHGKVSGNGNGGTQKPVSDSEAIKEGTYTYGLEEE